MARGCQTDPLWAQHCGGCTGTLRASPAHVALDSLQRANNQASRCCCSSSVTNPTGLRKWLAGKGRFRDGRCQDKELLRSNFFLDPAMQWGRRPGKKSSRLPDCQAKKETGEVLWLNKLFKPTGVNEELVPSEMQMGHGSSYSKSSYPRKPERGRRAGSAVGVLTAETVRSLCEQGQLTEAVRALEYLALTDYPISHCLFYAVLKVCANKKDLVMGRRVHDLTVKLGYESSTFLGNHILRMYACAGKLQEAMDVFTRVGKPDAFMWSSIISAHSKHGKPKEAIQLYHEMLRSGVKANAQVYVAALQACTFAADLESGRNVHCDVLRNGSPPNLFVGNCLVDMYAKCGELKDARKIFDSMVTKDVVTWTALIAGYANHGLGREALVVYGQMEQEGLIVADHIAFVFLLKACASAGDLLKGKQLHSQIVETGLLCNTLVGNSLVDMYAKCGKLKEARQVFEALPTKDVVTWTALIAGYVEQGLVQEALDLYGLMEEEALIVGNHVTFACLLKACASAGALQKGRQLHSQIVERGLDNILVGTCLVDMYAKCGELEDARRVFDSLATKNVVTWNALIVGYANHGLGDEALVLYGQMEQEGLLVGDEITFASLLKACASAGALQMGRQLHSQIVGRGLLNSILVGNCLVHMYSKCGELQDARRVFDSLVTKDVVTWTALIAGYSNSGLGQEALALYGLMVQQGLIVGNHVTFACLLKACASTGALQEGQQLHLQIVDRGLLDNTLVGSGLVNMYAKCGELEEARQVFDSLATKDVMTWTALIAGYAQQGLGQEALVLYEQMKQEGLIVADPVTFASLLKACTSAGARQTGRQLHLQIVERGELDKVLGNCLVDMYAKCGDLEAAQGVFDTLPIKDVVTWNSLIAGYGTCDEGHKALACFEDMLVSGTQPDDATFTCVLAACSHGGLVKEGRKHFDSMIEHHGIHPRIEHYNCMIDLLARAGHLDVAEDMLFSFESPSNVVGLMSLMTACKTHGDIERATRCFDNLITLEPQRASAYVLMANAYADAGRWTDVERIEARRLAAGANKKPAVAGIEVKKKVHTFVVGENRDEFALGVDSINARLKQEGGHRPHTRLVLKPLSEKEKEDVLCGHAEKLALAFGLLNTPSGSPLMVTKNLRMCSDCHSSTEIMSRVESREIVVRDGYRVHRFAGGSCSCKGRP